MKKFFTWLLSLVWTFDPKPQPGPSPSPEPGPSPDPGPSPAPVPAPSFDLLAMIKQARVFVDDTIEFLTKAVALTPSPTDDAYLAKLKSVVDVLEKAIDLPLLQQLLAFLTSHPGVLSLRGAARDGAIVNLAEQNAGAFRGGLESIGLNWSTLLQILPLVIRFLLSFAGKRAVQLALVA